MMHCCGHVPPFSFEAALEQVAVASQAVLHQELQRKFLLRTSASKDKCLEKSNDIQSRVILAYA